MKIERLPSRHRLARLSTWARLWLVWFASFLATISAHGLLSRDAERIATQWLDRVALLIARIVLIRAAKQIRLPGRRHGGPPRKRPLPTVRAILGSALRRRLYRGDVHARCARLTALIRDASAAVAALLRRLKNGLTRLRPVLPCAGAAAVLLLPPYPAPPVADTS